MSAIESLADTEIYDSMMLKAALAYAAINVPVFPCTETKRPLVDTGFKSATTDQEQIEHWWRQWPEALIGIPTGVASGIVVLDVDVKGDIDGGDSLISLMNAHDAVRIETLETITPSGGRHLYLRHPGVLVPCSAGKLGLGLDIRGDGGYIIAPPSSRDGRAYEWEGEDERLDFERIAKIPPWLLPLIAKKQRPDPDWQPDESTDPVELDRLLFSITRPEACQRDIWLRIGMAYKAGGGDFDTFYNWSWKRSGFESEQRLRTEWDSWRVDGGVTVGTLRYYAAQFGQHRVAVADTSGNAHENTLTAYRIPDNFNPSALEPRKWVIEGQILAGAVHALVAPGGVGKTSFLISRAIGVGLGLDKLLRDRVRESCVVWLINNEEPEAELHRRIAAVAKRFRLDVDEIRKRVLLTSGYGAPFRLVQLQNGTVLYTPIVEQVIAQIREHRVGYLAIDPLVSMHGLDENNNIHMDYVFQVLRYVAKETGCAIEVAVHTRKVGGNSESHAADAETMRGAVAQRDAVRGLFTLAHMSKETAKKLGIDERDARALIRHDDGKLNYAPRDLDTAWYKLESVSLDNHLDHPDRIGVVVPWELPSREAQRERESAAEQSSTAAILHRAMDAEGINQMARKEAIEILRSKFGIRDTEADNRLRAVAPRNRMNAKSTQHAEVAWELWTEKASSAQNASVTVKRERQQS